MYDPIGKQSLMRNSGNFILFHLHSRKISAKLQFTGADSLGLWSRGGNPHQRLYEALLKDAPPLSSRGVKVCILYTKRLVVSCNGQGMSAEISNVSYLANLQQVDQRLWPVVDVKMLNTFNDKKNGSFFSKESKIKCFQLIYSEKFTLEQYLFPY